MLIIITQHVLVKRRFLYAKTGSAAAAAPIPRTQLHPKKIAIREHKKRLSIYIALDKQPKLSLTHNKFFDR